MLIDLEQIQKNLYRDDYIGNFSFSNLNPEEFDMKLMEIIKANRFHGIEEYCFPGIIHELTFRANSKKQKIRELIIKMHEGNYVEAMNRFVFSSNDELLLAYSKYYRYPEHETHLLEGSNFRYKTILNRDENGNITFELLDVSDLRYLFPSMLYPDELIETHHIEKDRVDDYFASKEIQSDYLKMLKQHITDTVDLSCKSARTRK